MLYLRCLILALFCTLLSCGEKYSEELISTSPDKTAIIKVRGYKNSPLSAWITTLSVQYLAYHDSIKFEVYASEISKETVNFLWNDGECVVSFQQNDSKLNVNVTAKGGRLIIYKPDQNQLK
jgi:hypothetical protein